MRSPLSMYRLLLPLPALVLSALLLGACSNIETRPEDTATFAAGNYQYYSWRSEPLVNTINSRDSIYVLDPILRAQIDADLQGKGYTLDPTRAQFSVDYIFAEGLRPGVKGVEASNLSTYPGVIPDRNIDQASIDNANALGGLRETRNIGIQINDVARNEEVWRVIITKIVDNVNTNENPNLPQAIKAAIKQGLKTLPSRP